ncbi:MAG: sulfatase, partial [Anaerolineae bacterium]|nr:sulfatase [Anaerolineae bacterium]
VVSQLLQNIDIAPTLLDAAGLPVPSSMQGRSFWPLLTGGSYEPHQDIVIERNWHGDWDPMRAVRTKDFLYIRNFAESAKKAWLPDEMPVSRQAMESSRYHVWPKPELPRGREELFDVLNDPDEKVDLAEDPAYQEIKQELAARLDKWMHETEDPLLDGAIPDKLNGWPDYQGAHNAG